MLSKFINLDNFTISFEAYRYNIDRGIFTLCIIKSKYIHKQIMILVSDSSLYIKEIPEETVKRWNLIKARKGPT